MKSELRLGEYRTIAQAAPAPTITCHPTGPSSSGLQSSFLSLSFLSLGGQEYSPLSPCLPMNKADNSQGRTLAVSPGFKFRDGWWQQKPSDKGAGPGLKVFQLLEGYMG